MSSYPFPGIRRPAEPAVPRSWFGRLYHSWFGTPEQRATHVTLLTNTALFGAACFTVAVFGEFLGEQLLVPRADPPTQQPGGAAALH